MEEKEFDFSYIFSTLLKWSLLIIFFAVLGLAVAMFYNHSASIKYDSTTTLYVQPRVQSGDVDYEGILSNQKISTQNFINYLKRNKSV